MTSDQAISDYYDQARLVGYGQGYAAALDEAIDVIQTHEVSGYVCTCGADVNTLKGHLVAVLTDLRDQA